MIIKGEAVSEVNGRRSYPLGEAQAIVHHWAVYTTTPDRPFGPHKHERPEMWYIIDGEAVVSIDGKEQPVGRGDVIYLPSNVAHGLRSESRAEWICLG